jgi:hypothetical protein
MVFNNNTMNKFKEWVRTVKFKEWASNNTDYCKKVDISFMIEYLTLKTKPTDSGKYELHFSDIDSLYEGLKKTISELKNES